MSASGRQVEATERPVDLHRLSRLESLRKAPGVVAQGLDLEGDAAVSAIGAGDRERMGARHTVEGGKGDLAGTMPAPAAVRPVADLGMPAPGVRTDPTTPPTRRR